MLTQVLDEDHPVLGVVPHWVRALALRLDRLDVVPLAAGRFDPPAGVRVRSLGKRPDDPPVRALARLTLLGRFLRTVVPPLARGEVDLVFAHMVPLYAILGSLAGFAFGRRTVLWYAHRSLDAPVRVAHALVAAVATASASSFRLPSRKRRVLGHGVPLAALSASPGPAGEEPMLLSVGRLSPVKDLETLLDAAARLRAGPFPDLVLALVGAPPLPADAGYLDALHERARRLGIAGAVRFVGPVPYEEVPAWTRRAHWIASASRTGSLDKNGLEAIVARRPFFAANESFRPIWGEAAGLFAFEPGDAAGLAARLEAYERLAGPERLALLERLARRVETEHDLEGLADRLVELFRSVAR